LNTFIIALFILNVPTKKINFIGNKSISAGNLRQEIVSQKNNEFYDANITYDTEKILRVYNNHGFFSTEVTSDVNVIEEAVEITFTILEGSRPQIDSIGIQGVSRNEIDHLIAIKIGDYFIAERIDDTEKKIENYYKNRGYPFAVVTSSQKPDLGMLAFDIETGVIHYIRHINIHGLKSCNPKVVMREIELKRGDMYSKEKLYNSQREIYGLGFFSTIDVEMLKNEPDTLDLLFTVRELKSRILNLGLGFAIPVSFLFSFGLEELNLFNAGHRFQIRPSFKINIEGEWEAKLETKYTVPHVTPAQLTVSILPFYWYEDKLNFKRVTRGTEFRLSKVYSENIQYNFAHRYKFVDIRPKITLPDTSKGITNSIEFRFMVDFRDEFFNPKNGVFLLPRVEYAGGIFGGDNNFLRFEVEERFFLPLFGNTFAQRFKFGIMVPTDGIEVYEKYYLGGQYSLRGYPERSLGPDELGEERYGDIMANVNIEYRISLPWRFGLVGFLDVGFIDNEIDLENNEFLKSSAGVGLRYYTPIGPLRCDVGFPIAEEDADKRWEMYVGIYHIF
jgi:outer membrane protein insertion porin family